MAAVGVGAEEEGLGEEVMVLCLSSMRMEVGTATIGATVEVDLEVEGEVSVAEEEEDIMDLIWTCSKMEGTIMNHMLKAMVVVVGGETVEGVVAIDQMGRSRQLHETAFLPFEVDAEIWRVAISMNI